MAKRRGGTSLLNKRSRKRTRAKNRKLNKQRFRETFEIGDLKQQLNQINSLVPPPKVKGTKVASNLPENVQQLPLPKNTPVQFSVPGNTSNTHVPKVLESKQPQKVKPVKIKPPKPEKPPKKVKVKDFHKAASSTVDYIVDGNLRHVRTNPGKVMNTLGKHMLNAGQNFLGNTLRYGAVPFTLYKTYKDIKGDIAQERKGRLKEAKRIQKKQQQKYLQAVEVQTANQMAIDKARYVQMAKSISAYEQGLKAFKAKNYRDELARQRMMSEELMRQEMERMKMKYEDEKRAAEKEKAKIAEKIQYQKQMLEQKQKPAKEKPKLDMSISGLTNQEQSVAKYLLEQYKKKAPPGLFNEDRKLAEINAQMAQEDTRNH